MKNVLSTLSLLVLTACPAAPLESVDGLAGGNVTSKITAPAVEATEVTTESLDATGDVTAASVTAGAVTSSGPLSGSSVVVQRGAARVAFFGLIVGTAPLASGDGDTSDGTTANYAARHAACASAFPATDALPPAHVCTAQEAMAHAVQAPDTVPASATNGIVHSYGNSWFAAPDEDGTEQAVNDAGALTDGPTRGVSAALRLHRRSDNAWTLRVERTTVEGDPLVCCQ